MKKLLLWLLLGLGWSPSLAHAIPWKEARLPHLHFHFRYPARWTQAAQHLIQQAPTDLKRLETAFGFQLKKTLRIRLSSPGTDFAKIQPHHWYPHPQIAGLAYPDKLLITMRIRSIEGLDGLHQTFVHELSHLLLAVASQHRQVPLWFNEGVAMWLSGDLGDLRRMTTLAGARIRGDLPTLEQLKYHFPHKPSAKQIAYAISLDAVLFLKNQHPQLLPTLLAHIRHGSTFAQALQKSTGIPALTLYQNWRKSINRRYGWLLLLANEATIWLLAVGLFLLAYLKIKQQRRYQLAQLENES